MLSDFGKPCSFCFYVCSYVDCSVIYVPIKAIYSKYVQCSNMIEVNLELRHPHRVCNNKVGYKVVKTQLIYIEVSNGVNKTICFGSRP